MKRNLEVSVGERESDKQTDRLICKDIDLKWEALTGQGGSESKELRRKGGHWDGVLSYR